MMTVGRYLKTKRFFKEMTLQQVVDAVKEQYNFSTSTSVLSAVETGKNKSVDSRLLFVLTDLYDIDLNELKEVVLNGVKK